MAEIKERFIQAKTKSGFKSRLEAGDIKDNSIVFIEDSSEIWTKGKYYPCPYTKESLDNKFLTEVSLPLATKVDKVEGKLLSTNDYTTAEKNKVAESINESTANTLINTAIGNLTKASVGLNNVDNTADANKEVLSATKLKTARTLWGQSFNGTANVSGTLQDVTEIYTTDGSKYAEPCTSDDIKALFV